MYPSPIWNLKYLRVAWKPSFTLISTRITAPMVQLQLSLVRVFGFFFFLSEQKKNGGNTDLIPPEVSLNYLEKINRMKPMYQHTLDTWQIHGQKSDIIGEKRLAML